MSPPLRPRPSHAEGDWRRSLAALVLTLLIAQGNLFVGRTMRAHSKLSLLDLTQPAGYTPNKDTDREGVDRRDVADLLERLTAPAAFMAMPEPRQRMLAESIDQVKELAKATLWHTLRLLEVLDDKNLAAYHKIFNDSLALNSCFRADWVWIGEQDTAKLRIPASIRTTAPPKGWDPLRDSAFERWQRVTWPYNQHFVQDLTLEAQSKVLLVSLTSLSPQEQRALGADRLARLQAEARQLCDSARNLQTYWRLFEQWIIEDAKAGNRRPPHEQGEDLDFAMFTQEFERASERMHNPRAAQEPRKAPSPPEPRDPAAPAPAAPTTGGSPTMPAAGDPPAAAVAPLHQAPAASESTR